MFKSSNALARVVVLSGITAGEERINLRDSERSHSGLVQLQYGRDRSLRISKATLFLLLLIGATISSCSCGSIAVANSAFQGSPNTKQVAEIDIEPTTSEKFVGQVQQFTAVLRDEGGNVIHGIKPDWSSSDPAAFAVNQQGLAKFLTEGSGSIVAKVGTVQGVARVAVKTVKKVILLPTIAQIAIGDSVRFVATAYDGNGNIVTGVPYTYSCNPAVCSISGNGQADGVGAGNSTVTATAPNGVSGSASLTVQATPPPPPACSGGGQSANFYVATNGNDSWSGTLDCPNADNTDGPFASIAKAQLAVEALLTSHPAIPSVVMIRNGTYYLALSPTNPGPLNFSASDSGTASTPVTWRNYPEEVPIVSGGIPVMGWSHISENLWQVQLPPNTQPFEMLLYNGQRRIRGRVQSAGGVGYFMSNGSCLSTQTGQSIDISFCNLGTFLRVASPVAPPDGVPSNCPSITSSRDSNATKCMDRFAYNPTDPIVSWSNLNGTYSGNPIGTGFNGPCKANPSSPYPQGDVEVTLFDSWTVDIMRIACIDTQAHVVYLTGPMEPSSSGFNYFGPVQGHRYIVENAVEAFQSEHAAGQTGIWFLDRSSSPWTLNYLAAPGENPNTDTVIVPQLGGPIPGCTAATQREIGDNTCMDSYIGASLLYANGLDYVTFSGLTFEADDFYPDENGFNNDVNSELTVPQAIDCESCAFVTFDNITVRHTSASAIALATFQAGFPRNVAECNSKALPGPQAKNDSITNSLFYDLGSSGVRIGHVPNGGDKNNCVPTNLTVQSNLVQGYSRIFADGEGVAMANGNTVGITHNDINDGYHAGISICLWGCTPMGIPASSGALCGSGSSSIPINGSCIASTYNHVWNTGQGITNDGMTIYYDVGTNGNSGFGNQIYNNLVHDVVDSSPIDSSVSAAAYGGDGIYLDIASAGIDVQNNVIFHTSDTSLSETMGPGWSSQYGPEPANNFSNNIVAYSNKAMFQDMQSWFEFTNQSDCSYASLRNNVTSNIFYFDRDDRQKFAPIQGCAYSCGLPFNQFQNFQANLWWRTDGQLASCTTGTKGCKTFHVVTSPPTNPSTCTLTSDPDGQWTWLNFLDWQSSSSFGTAPSMNEDVTGTVSVNPGFGNTGEPSDYLLSSTPIVGFDYNKTNDTINNAGRTDRSETPAPVPPTFPTYGIQF